jgi:Ca-activated chloride channel family protein
MDTTRPGRKRISLRPTLIRFIILLLGCASAFAQAQPNLPPPKPAGQQAQPQVTKPKGQPFTLKRDVDLVRMQVTVLDKKGNFVPELKEQNFRVWENGVPQKIAAFTGEDVPVGVGLVIDNSASMKSKRLRVNAAALDFVKSSNPQDQVFVVNFNDEFYLDMDTDFTNDQSVLRAALERIDSRGGTALYDAILGSIHHLRKSVRDKKVLLVVTDGEDNSSQHSLDQTVEMAAKSNVVIYAVGLFTKGDDSREEIREGKKALKALTQATGGEVYFPSAVDDVNRICTRIAEDIRDQYTIGYYPTDTAKDGTFRQVKVELVGVKGLGKLTLRTRPGYYAPSGTSAAVAAAGD